MYDDFLNEQKKYNGFDKEQITLKEVEDLITNHHPAPLVEFFDSYHNARIEFLTEKNFRKILDYYEEDRRYFCSYNLSRLLAKFGTYNICNAIKIKYL